MRRFGEFLWLVLISVGVVVVSGCVERPVGKSSPPNTTVSAGKKIDKIDKTATETVPGKTAGEEALPPSGPQAKSEAPAESKPEEKAAGSPGEPDQAANDNTHSSEGEAKMNVTKESYGELPDGTEVDLYTLANGKGMKVKIITYGAMITSVETPDRDGKATNITLHRSSLQEYLDGHPFFGVMAGRYANRIAQGKFTLDGKEYSLATNNGPNHLHGGVKGFDKHVWKAESVNAEGAVGVKLTLVSPDGDEGYPGTLTATVTYLINSDNELKMDYTATTDKPTVVNLTNHAYWNLGGAAKGDALDHVMMINADKYLPVDDTLIPLGDPAPVKDTPMDFTKPMPIGSRIEQVKGGYDHCYVLNKKEGEELTLVARVVDPDSGRTMEIHTTQPAVQFYTGNFLDGTITTEGVVYKKHHAFCLETEHYPDSPNRPDFPSTVLKPGDTYHQVTVHKFGVEK